MIRATLALGLLTVICASSLAACGGAKEKEKPVVAKTETATPAPTEAAVGAEEVPGDVPAEEATTEDSDVKAVKEAVAFYLTDFLAGDGESACSRLTDAAVATTVTDGVERTPDETFAVCVDAIAAFGSAVSDEERAELDDVELSDVTIDGDTASVLTTLSDAPITLERGDTGWLLATLPSS